MSNPFRFLKTPNRNPLISFRIAEVFLLFPFLKERTRPGEVNNALGSRRSTRSVGLRLFMRFHVTSLFFRLWKQRTCSTLSPNLQKMERCLVSRTLSPVNNKWCSGVRSCPAGFGSPHSHIPQRSRAVRLTVAALWAGGASSFVTPQTVRGAS